MAGRPRKSDLIPPKLTRAEKAFKIVFQKDAIKRIDENTYQVRSQSGNGSYVVISTPFGKRCSCPDHSYRNLTCKHIIAVNYSQHLRREVESSVKPVISEVTNLACRFCSSGTIVKKAKRYNKYGAIQRYLCKSCNKRFSFNIGFKKMHASPQIITTAMQLYFTGESLRNVQKFIRLQGLNKDARELWYVVASRKVGVVMRRRLQRAEFSYAYDLILSP